MKAHKFELEDLIGRFEPLIRSFIGKYNHGKYGLDIDDLLQEAEIRLWKVLENGHDIRFLSSYLDKVVYSIVLSRFKQMDKERSASCSEELRGYFEKNIVQDRADASREEMKGAVRRALDSIRESRRIALDLTLSGLSIQEIAERQGWTLKKTYSLYERGLRDIKSILGRKGLR